MSFSRESQYRNIFATGDFTRERRGVPPVLVVGCLALLLMVCCNCAGLVLGLQLGGGVGNLTSSARLPFASKPTLTPTVDRNAPVPLRMPGLMDNKLELTVINVQRPLKVEGGIALPPNQQFILVTVKIANKSSAPLQTTAADFKVRGGGGLTYDANPKTVTISNLLTDLSIAPGRTVEAELIFQIAVDDWDLQLFWKAGNQTRAFKLER